MIFQAILILFVYSICVGNSRFPYRESYKTNSRDTCSTKPYIKDLELVYNDKDKKKYTSKRKPKKLVPMDKYDIFLMNMGLDKAWNTFKGVSYKDGKMSIKTRWYLRHFFSTGYSSEGITLKPKWGRIFVLGVVVLAIAVVGTLTGFWFFILGAVFTSKATGNFDAVGATTWNEANFPVTGDTFTVQNTHVVSIKGTEASGSGTIDAGGTLRFDGQVDSVVARLSLDNGATLQNDGTIDSTGTGSTGYAYLVGVSDEPLTNGDISYGGGYWAFNEIDIQVDVTTGGGTCTVEFTGDCTVDGITVTANDTLKCVTQDVTITGSSAAKWITVSGDLTITGASGHNVVFTRTGGTASSFNFADNTSTVSMQYVTITNYRFMIGGGGTQIPTSLSLDNLTIVNADSAAMYVYGTNATVTVSNSSFDGEDAAGWSTKGIAIMTAGHAQLDTCTFTALGMGATGATWLVSKDGSSNFTIYGILASSETPSAGYRAADITGDLTLSQADAYSSSFSTSYTLGANCVNVDNLTIDASTTFDTSGTNYTYTASVTTGVSGTMNTNASTCSFASGYTGGYALRIETGGDFNGGSGTHTMGSIRIAGTTNTLSTGTTTINGTNGAPTLAIVFSNPTTFDDGNGTIVFTRAGNQYLYDLNNTARTFYNVIVNNASYNLQHDNANGFHLTVANNLTITSGTFDTSETVSGTSRDLTVTNDLSIAASGVLTGNNSTITCTNDISNAGTFNYNTSDFVMNGTSQAITGSWTFYDFTKAVAAADTLTFENGETITIENGGTVTLNGASGQLLSLVSDAPGTAWNFTMVSGAIKGTMAYLDVADSDASGSDATQKPINPSSSTDSLGNTDWFPKPVGGVNVATSLLELIMD